MFNYGQIVTENCMKVMKEEIEKSNTHQISIFDFERNTFSVKEMMNHSEGKSMGRYKVNLLNGWCVCGKLQAYCVP